MNSPFCGQWKMLKHSFPENFPFLQGIKNFLIPVPERVRNILFDFDEPRDIFLFHLQG